MNCRSSFASLYLLLVSLLVLPVSAQNILPASSKVWTPDADAAHYKNPVLYADYSDPDVIRVGEDYYLVASSFNDVPGLPILHSRDLVHWQLIAHALMAQPPVDVYRNARHGTGVWAPAIRFHAGEFYIFYPDPDYGIYMIKAKAITGPWSEPLLIKAAKGWIDPCPLWDDDGKAYLVNGLAASRAGINSVIVLTQMAADGSRLLGDSSILVDGHDLDPTLEGPKIYKRGPYYYLFAPAGGVTQGWQVVYRAKNIAGPYERRKVLAQGKTQLNGPHQGAWVTTAEGEDWFLHFQDMGAYGRVVNLEPMSWQNDWPVMGINIAADGLGEPVASYRKPRIKAAGNEGTPADSDEFNRAELGLQWQWQANPQPGWAFPSQALGVLRLVNVAPEGGEQSLWKTPNVLLQKLPAPEFTATTRVEFKPRFIGEETGLVVMGQSYAALGLVNTDHGLALRVVQRKDAAHDGVALESARISVVQPVVYLRAKLERGAVVHFSYSTDGKLFIPLGDQFTATPGLWVGAKIGLYAVGAPQSRGSGYADFDWFRLEP